MSSTHHRPTATTTTKHENAIRDEHMYSCYCTKINPVLLYIMSTIGNNDNLCM